MADTFPPALRLTGVSKSFPGVRALKNVTFDVPDEHFRVPVTYAKL